MDIRIVEKDHKLVTDDAANMEPSNYEQYHLIVTVFYETVEEADKCFSKTQDAPGRKVFREVLGVKFNLSTNESDGLEVKSLQYLLVIHLISSMERGNLLYKNPHLLLERQKLQRRKNGLVVPPN